MFLNWRKNVALSARNLYYQLSESIRIFTRTPLHKRKRLSLFLLGMWILTIFSPSRSLILRSVYLWFRYVDDVADQELENPCRTLEEFMNSKREFLENIGEDPAADYRGIDVLMAYAHRKCLKLGFNLIPSMLTILEAVNFDVLRSQESGVPSREAIAKYFEKLDFPTVLETLRIMGEENVQVSDLHGFMDATRVYFNLRDVVQDAKLKIVNIPVEEATSFGIDPARCSEADSLEALMEYDPFQRWFAGQLGQMKNFLASGMGMLKARRAKFVIKLMLYVGFALPCQKFIAEWDQT